MKKYIFIIIIAMLAAPLGAEAQRKSGSKSSSSKSSSVRSSSSKKSSATVKKAVRSTPSVKRSSPAVRSASRSSSPGSRAVVKTVSRSSSSSSGSVVRTTPRSSSSSSGSVVKTTPRNPSSNSGTVVRTNPGNNNTRSATAVRSASQNTVTGRTSTAGESAGRTKPSIQAGNNNPGRSAAQTSAAYNSGNGINRPWPGKANIYHSTRRFIHERPIHYRYRVAPHPRDYRARFYPYRRPVYFHMYWSYNIFLHYCSLYPVIERWSYYPDYSVTTISAYDALFHVGEIRRVYGKVSEVYYAAETDEFFLYFGAYYPHHDFTVVIPGEIARRYSRHPEFYFEDEHIEVTGLITEYDDKPEIVVKEKNQLERY